MAAKSQHYRPPLYFGNTRYRLASIGLTPESLIWLPSSAISALLVALIYLNSPLYVYYVSPSFLPKYQFYAFVMICSPWLLMTLAGKAGFSPFPFTYWSIATVFLMSLHLLGAISEGDTLRAEIITDSLDYVVLGALLGLAFSSILPRQYIFVFPILTFVLTSAIIFDFLYPGTLYSLQIEGAVLGRGAGPYVNSNTAGEVLLLTLLFAMSSLRGLPLLLLFLFSGVGVLLTFSRAAIMAWALLWPYALYMRIIPRYTYIILLGLVLIVPMILTIVTNYISAGGFEGAIGNIEERLAFFQNYSLDDASSIERSEVLWAGVETFLEHPILGAGGGYTYLWASRSSTHNELVLLCAEYGIFGLGLWIWMLVILWRGSYFINIANQRVVVLYFLYFSFFSHNLFDELPLLFSFAILTQRRNIIDSVSLKIPHKTNIIITSIVT